MFIGLLDHKNICLDTNFAFISALVPKIWAFKNFDNLSGGHFEKSIKNAFLMAGLLGAFFLWLVELNGLQKRYNRFACNFVRVGL